MSLRALTLARRARWDSWRRRVQDDAAPDPAKFLLGERRARPIGKRDLILRVCHQKDVLDLGCVEHSWRMSIDNPSWLHAAIRDVAASCVGVDFLADDVAELNKRGFEMVYGDVLRDEPPGRFDVVVAGDLVEHLGNPSWFLDYVGRALRPDGIAVVTTPNALYLDQFLTVLLRGRPDISPEHALLFDPFTFATLVSRSPLRLRALHWLEPSWSVLWNAKRPAATLGRTLHLVTYPVIAWRPYLNSDFAAVMELRKSTDEQFSAGTSAAAVMEWLGCAPSSSIPTA